MLFETIMIVLGSGISVFFIGIPAYKIVRKVFPSKRDALKDAQEQLAIARKELEAHRLQKEASKLYDQIYDETLEDDSSDETQQSNRNK